MITATISTGIIILRIIIIACLTIPDAILIVSPCELSLITFPIRAYIVVNASISLVPIFPTYTLSIINSDISETAVISSLLLAT